MEHKRFTSQYVNAKLDISALPKKYQKLDSGLADREVTAKDTSGEPSGSRLQRSSGSPVEKVE